MKHLTTLLSALIVTLASLPLQSSESAEVLAPAGEQAQLTLEDIRTFTDVFNQIRKNFVEEVDDYTLLTAAINGMIHELDPHSSFMDSEEYSDLDDSARGRYSGIGVEVTTQDGRIVIVAATRGGPAAENGIRSGDMITAIDGRPIRGRRLQSAISELRGEPGSEVSLRIEREGERPREVTVERRYVPVPSVSSQLLDEHYGHFHISHFHRDSDADLRTAILEMQEQHKGQLRGIILDLRNNPGGVVQPAIAIADGFLDDGLIVYTRGRQEANQLEFHAKPGQWAGDTPLVVLVDGATASASEILAGALQDHERALIVGSRTFGKGSVQSILALRNGSAIKLTTSRYFTPAGRSIQAEGIVPDVVVPEVELLDSENTRLREADLQGHLDGDHSSGATATVSDISAEEDYALHQALNLLKGADILSRSQSLPTSMHAKSEH